MKLISIVIPCYNSQATIRKVVEMVMEELKKMEQYECEFVLVNDGSPKDDTYGEIQRLGEDYANVKGVNLLRNFGQHNALMAALHYTSGDYILGMDDDMQTHPSQISKLIHKMEEGFDLVYGCYPKKKNSFLKNLSSKINEVSSRILLGRPKNIVSSNFWMITRQVRDEVIKYDSFNPYIDGIFYRTTHKIGNVDVAGLLELFCDSAAYFFRIGRYFSGGRLSCSIMYHYLQDDRPYRCSGLVLYHVYCGGICRSDPYGSRNYRGISG